MSEPKRDWVVRTTEGEYLGPLSKLEIAKGLLDGWILLDDEARDNPSRGWVRIRVRLHPLFEVKALTNCKQAFAAIWAPKVAWWAGILALIGYISRLVYAVPGFDVSGAIWFLVITVLGLLLAGVLCARFPNPLTWLFSVGCLSLVGGGLLLYVTGVTIDLTIHLKRAMTLTLVGGMAGYGLGYGLGWLVGASRRGVYSPPSIRQSIPHNVVVSICDPWHENCAIPDL